MNADTNWLAMLFMSRVPVVNASRSLYHLVRYNITLIDDEWIVLYLSLSLSHGTNAIRFVYYVPESENKFYYKPIHLLNSIFVRYDLLYDTIIHYCDGTVDGLVGYIVDCFMEHLSDGMYVIIKGENNQIKLRKDIIKNCEVVRLI